MIPTLQEQITIEEILAEAEAFGLRSEVRDEAEQVWLQRKNEEEFTLLDAYHIAYHTLIK